MTPGDAVLFLARDAPARHRDPTLERPLAFLGDTPVAWLFARGVIERAP